MHRLYTLSHNYIPKIFIQTRACSVRPLKFETDFTLHFVGKIMIPPLCTDSFSREFDSPTSCNEM